MKKADFLALLKEKHCLSESVIRTLDNELHELVVRKEAIIVEQEKRFLDLIFLIDGVVISTLLRDGKEHVTHISFEGDVIAIPLKENRISNVTLTALEDCVLLRMNFMRFELLMGEDTHFALFGYRIIKNLLSLMVEEYFDYTGLEATQAYEKMLKDKPKMLHHIPLKYIASNLGITASSLSRIRAANAHKKTNNK